LLRLALEKGNRHDQRVLFVNKIPMKSQGSVLLLKMP